jgi:formate/nitrite transporter
MALYPFTIVSYSHLLGTFTMNDVESGAQTDPELAASPDQAVPSRALAKNLAAMVSTPRTKAPKDALKAVYSAGKYKADLTLDLLVVQSFMAGLYIGMASHLHLALGGGVLGSVFSFPTSLIAVLLTSAELFTGDALIFVASVLGGKVSIRSLFRNWTVSWICNMAGCLVWAYFMVYLPDSLKDLDKNEYAIEVALKKANQSWGSTFLKGIGANFMACLAVWQFTCAQEVAGKILTLWFLIVGFVIIGFDNSIANQFFIRKLLLLLLL